MLALLVSAMAAPLALDHLSNADGSQVVVSPSTPLPLPVTPRTPNPFGGTTPVSVPPAGSPPPPSPTTQNVTNLSWTSANPPTPRQGAAFAYDPKLGGDILFGGQNGSQFLGDTWEFYGGQWIQLPLNVAPAPRAGAVLTFDKAAGYLLLFGGVNSTQAFGDTWAFARDNWTLVSGLNSTAPSPRGYAAMAYNSTTPHGAVVLFGGRGPTGDPLGDTWEFTGKLQAGQPVGTWTNLTPLLSVAPTARSDSGLVYDAHDSYLFLFGGMAEDGAATNYFDDSWTFAAGAWSLVNPSNPPPARADFSLVYDQSLSETVLFGGATLSATNPQSDVLFSDTWIYAGGLWTKPVSNASTPAPAPRWGAEAAWDNASSEVILADGSIGGSPLTATDYWSFNGNWTPFLHPLLYGPAPSERMFPAIANDSFDSVMGQKVKVYGSVLLFGGETPIGMDNQTWLFENQYWTERFPTMAPSPRDAAALTCYCATGGFMLLFGGRSPSGAPLGDTWEYSHGNWTNLTSHLSGAPSPRWGAGILYDTVDAKVVLFGGTDGTHFFGDTWQFTSTGWTNITQSPSPGPRAFPGFTYAGDGPYGLLFGGLNSSAVLGDTWTFKASTWSELTLSLSPLASWDAGLDFIQADSDSLLFGGCAQFEAPSAMTCNAPQNVTWKFFSSKWALPPIVGGGPSTRFAQAATYDGADGLYFVWGGSDGTNILTDRWGLQGNVWSRWTPQISPTAREGMSVTYSHAIDHMLFYGGYGITPTGTLGYLNQTWMWDTGVWGVAYRPVSPSARAYAAEGTDLSPSTVVLFGGFGPHGYLGDTWTWEGGIATGRWTNVTNLSDSPAPRANASMTTIYSTEPTQSNEILLFGGQNGTTDFADTWIWSDGAWSKVVTPSHPEARASASMVFDDLDDYVVLFGGVNTTTHEVYNDTWIYSAGIWIKIATSHAPSQRFGAGMTLAFATYSSGPLDFNFVELYGGETAYDNPASDTYLNDTWAFLDGGWTQIDVGPNASKVNPPPAAYAAMSDDLDDGNPIIFGGVDGGLLQSEFWVWSSNLGF